ncbi:MAG TPA: inorganic pyrophosphatase [Vicinamibacterales bacterium]|jgi:inorganic pyrophosphatase|nr:inorganic pyrophosphatase [Vicinamibacterales bacterium]
MGKQERGPRAPSTGKKASKVSHFRPHPWHGLEVGPEPPDVLNAYIEITPFDLMKYEVDKVSGYLRIDRPQRSSAQHPALYGFVPRTYCATRVGRLAPGARRGDGDPLDICVLSERAITRNEILIRGRVIGGLQMIDNGEADDKIISVLENDYVWGDARDLQDVPPVWVERLQHYFETYKLVPGQRARARVASVYGRVHAVKVVRAAMADYDEAYGEGAR